MGATSTKSSRKISQLSAWHFIRPIFVDFLFFISARMYFHCRTYFPIITDLTWIMISVRTRSSAFKMAVLIQYLVHCKSAKKCLLNWKICAVNPPMLTFSEFFKHARGQRVEQMFCYCFCWKVEGRLHIGGGPQSCCRWCYPLMLAAVLGSILSSMWS